MINPLENPEIARREFGQGVIKCAAVATGASLLGASVFVPAKKARAEELIKPDEPLVGEAYALFAEDGSLTFVRSETPIADGDIYDGKTVTNSYTGFETESYDYYTVPWKANQVDVINISFKDEIMPVSTAYWFYGMKNCTSMDLIKLDTSNVTDMYNMFFNCRGLTSLDVRRFNTSMVKDMTQMFSVCSKLTSLDVSVGSILQALRT